MELNSNGSDLIRVLEFPECVRAKHGMYLSSPTDMLRECIDNSTDEVLACKTCNLIIVDTNFDGYNLVCDQGRGIPIFLSPDKPGRTQADVAVSTLHAGSKFVNQDSKIGTYGIGVSATNALSSHFWILSKITQENYDKSIPEVKSFYESLGPRSRKEIFYFAYFEKGIKVSEGAAKKSDLEGMMGLHKQLPEGMSTMTLFIVDPEIFPTQRVEIPIENLENFLFIQEKFYRRKIQVIANSQVLTSASIKPYQFEILRTITPADISKNPYIGVYVTFEVDASLAPKKTAGSVNGLVVNNGVHIQYLESCFEAALREEYKIKHKTIFPGLKMWVIILAEDLVYDSQIKSRLRSISKVKATDFQEIIKDFIKIFRKNEDYWLAHVNKLNALAESYRSIGAIEKAQKMIDSATGNNAFRSKQEYVEGFADATSHDRWGCELFVCFTGDTEVTTFDNERINLVDLEKQVKSGEKVFTFSCDSKANLIPTRILAVEKIKDVTKLCRVTLDNGESFVCTPDHKHMLRDGSYKETKDLQTGELMMSLDIEEEIRVDSVEIYQTEKTPVYCLEVSSEEHNFPLAAGIFTKNCEGISAAGGLKAGRKSTEYHAVLPLRGKVLNVKDASVDEALANKEIFTLLKVIGLGIDANNVTSDCKTREEAYEKIKKYSRYSKICIATD
jgi:DNA gyrase subunit B